MHPFIPVLSPSFLYHPYIPSFKSKDFSFTCLLSFFLLHTAYYSEEYIAWGYLLLFTHLLRVVGIVLCMYALIWASYRHFKERLPEAICCCLQTCNVDVVLLVMYCRYIPAFIVTSADISQLWIYLCYLLIYCLRLFLVVYKLVMFKERG